MDKKLFCMMTNYYMVENIERTGIDMRYILADTEAMASLIYEKMLKEEGRVPNSHGDSPSWRGYTSSEIKIINSDDYDLSNDTLNVLYFQTKNSTGRTTLGYAETNNIDEAIGKLGILTEPCWYYLVNFKGEEIASKEHNGYNKYTNEYK